MAEESPGVVTPVVPVAPAADAAPAPESTADQVVETPEGEKPEAPPERTFTQKELDDIVQRRIAKASRQSEKLGEERARRESAERELERVRAERNPQPTRPSGEPQPKDFQDWDSYQAALVDYRVDQKLGKARQESQAEQHRREDHERAQTVQQKLAPAKAKYEDFDEVALADNVPITEPMAAFIGSRDKGGDVAYYLGSHLDEATRISRLHPIDQVIALRELETTLAAPPAPTRTPAPIVPNGTNARATLEYSPTMSDSDYNRWRKAQSPKGR